MPRFLALDADGAGAAVLAVTVDKGGAVTVDGAVVVPVDPAAPPLGAGAAAFGAALRDALKAAGIKPAPLLVVVGRDQVVFKDVKHPPSAPADEPAIVKFQAVRDLADAADDVVMDYRPLGATPDGDRKAQVLFVRKPVVAAARTLAGTLGVRLAAVTPRPFAVAEAVRTAAGAGDAPVAVLTPGERGGEFTVVRGGDVAFTRAVSAAAFATPQSLAGELKRNLTVAATQAGAAAVAGVFVAESPDALGGWSDRLEGLLPGPVTPFDPLDGLGAAVDTVPVSQRGRFAGAVGAALSRARHPVLPVNFAEPRQPRADPGPNRARVLAGALLALAAAAGLGLYGFLELGAADASLALQQSRAQQLETEGEALKTDAARLAAVDQFDGRETNILDTLYDLAVRVPDVGKVTVTEFDLQPIGLTKPKPNEKPAAVPAGTVTIVARTGDTALGNRFASTFGKSDPFAVGFAPKVTPEQGGKVTVYRLVGQMWRMLPADYTRRLAAPKPVAPDEFDEANSSAGVPAEESP